MEWRQRANRAKMAQIGPKGRSRAPDESAHLFFRSFDRVDDFTYPENERNRTVAAAAWRRKLFLFYNFSVWTP